MRTHKHTNVVAGKWDDTNYQPQNSIKGSVGGDRGRCKEQTRNKTFEPTTIVVNY